MTSEEAKTLKPGDRVMARIGGKWVIARVLNLWISDRHGLEASVRRVGRNKQNGRYPVLYKHHGSLRMIPKFDGISSNVFADWLEDEGFTDAASAIRLAFPIEDGKGEE